jgi:serine/threonine protein kinase
MNAVFLDHTNSVKLGDFGVSKILESRKSTSTTVGTPQFMSPEIIQGRRYGLKSDIWALGCTIYQICAKVPPFEADNDYGLDRKIMDGQYEAIPGYYSQDLADVIANCLQVSPEERPNTAQLLNLLIMKERIRVQKRGATMHRNMDKKLLSKWETQARLEIHRQVKKKVKYLKEKNLNLVNDLNRLMEERERLEAGVIILEQTVCC